MLMSWMCRFALPEFKYSPFQMVNNMTELLYALLRHHFK